MFQFNFTCVLDFIFLWTIRNMNEYCGNVARYCYIDISGFTRLNSRNHYYYVYNWIKFIFVQLQVNLISSEFRPLFIIFLYWSNNDFHIQFNMQHSNERFEWRKLYKKSAIDVVPFEICELIPDSDRFYSGAILKIF